MVLLYIVAHTSFPHNQNAPCKEKIVKEAQNVKVKVYIFLIYHRYITIYICYNRLYEMKRQEGIAECTKADGVDLCIL